MRKFMLLILALILFSCEDTTYKEYKGNAPVYMSYDELRASVAQEQARDLENPGKIYFKDNYIFIIEEFAGIHVFDNANPSNPVKKSFVKVPGIVDMAIAGNTMYADSFTDVVVLSLDNVNNIRETGRLKDILPYTTPPIDNTLPVAKVDKDKGLVVEWEVRTIRERVYDNPMIYPYARVTFDGMFTASGAKINMPSSGGVSSSGVGIGGSMARFGIKDNTLYMVDERTLRILDITSRSNPLRLFDMNLGWGIETMFLTAENMFLGTTTGMLIYDIKNPQAPQWRSTYSHVRSCDPVIVSDTLAYVTLRTGTNCGGSLNTLDVVSIKTITAPKRVVSYPMTNPHGLGKDGNTLFVCDGAAGLKIYDASNPMLISANLKKGYPGIKAFDVIPLGNVLVMIGDDGLYQYDYSSIDNIRLLSKIPVTRKD